MTALCSLFPPAFHGFPTLDNISSLPGNLHTDTRSLWKPVPYLLRVGLSSDQLDLDTRKRNKGNQPDAVNARCRGTISKKKRNIAVFH
jgi:hypothetical protein